MKKIAFYILSAVIALAMIETIGCGGASRHKITLDSELRSKLVVRGQSHKKPSKAKRSEFVWPIEGPVMSQFGIRWGRRHDGVDISGHNGDPIRAASDGEVVFSGKMHGYGNLILLRHDDNYFTAYAHNSANLVGEGKEVRQGDIIAEVGRTGRATGNHLHFEIRHGQEAMDPLAFLPASEGVYVMKHSHEGKAKYAGRDGKRGSKYAMKVKSSSKKDAAESKKTIGKGKKGKGSIDLAAKNDSAKNRQDAKTDAKNKPQNSMKGTKLADAGAKTSKAKSVKTAKTDSRLQSLNELTAEAKTAATNDPLKGEVAGKKQNSNGVETAQNISTASDSTKTIKKTSSNSAGLSKKGVAANTTKVAKKEPPAANTTKTVKKTSSSAASTKVAKKSDAKAAKPVSKKTPTPATTKVAKKKTADATKVAKAKPASQSKAKPAPKKEIVMKESGVVKKATNQ